MHGEDGRDSYLGKAEVRASVLDEADAGVLGEQRVPHGGDQLSGSAGGLEGTVKVVSCRDGTGALGSLQLDVGVQGHGDGAPLGCGVSPAEAAHHGSPGPDGRVGDVDDSEGEQRAEWAWHGLCGLEDVVPDQGADLQGVVSDLHVVEFRDAVDVDDQVGTDALQVHLQE